MTDAAVTGRVHSLETFGTVDGPGTRLVVFCQGCPMRCAYCHNPDTWGAGGEVMSVGAVLDAFERNRAFYRNGGITVSGGEPLMQPAFVAALFRAAHDAPGGRIHTALDTSGIAWGSGTCEAIGEVLDATDLVLLDIKHPDPETHRWLTGQGAERPLAFADELARRGVPTIIRHVVLPGVSDDKGTMAELGRLIARWPNVVGLELLPYHTMGVGKYEKRGIPYRLADVPAMDPTRLPELRQAALAARADALAGM